MPPQTNIIDYSRKWYVMAAVAMSFFLATIDGSIVNVAMPTLVKDLNTNFPTVQWVVLAYLLTQTTLILSIGRLGDMIGKKSIYTWGIIIFTLGSVLCGLAPTVYWLIAFRILQAVGAAMTLALGLAIITEAFPPQERGKAFGSVGTTVSLGVVLGPTLGGVIISLLSWHWIFLVNLPVGILGTYMAIRFIPDFKPIGKQNFDYGGALTLFISLISLLLALTVGQELGFSDNRILGLFATWFIFLLIFLAIEWRSPHPMVNLRLFQNILFSVNLVTGFITFVAISGISTLMPFYLQDVLGYDTMHMGLLLAIFPIALGVVAPISGSLSDRLGTRPITVLGLIFMVGGYIAMSTLAADTTILRYVLSILPVGIGMGIFQSPNNSAIMGSTPREQLGVASGLLTITRTLGQTSGFALSGAFWASRVMFHEGTTLTGGVTAASSAAQVAGLQDTFQAIVVLIVVALIISIFGLIQEQRHGKTMPIPHAAKEFQIME